MTNAQRQRDFALKVVRRLREAGHEAYWAGGCVRDQLLGREPKDYDVATSARPEEIRRIFGRRRTLRIGAAFGVITVLGPEGAGQIEVATFRRDADYSDGRHPDRVTFSDAREDALRRDFTINGLFYDPLAGEVIDFVGGQEDLDRRVVRAIGDPAARIDEDKLRMLRAVRFAATFDFALDDATRDAIAEHADEVTVVSAERIGEEMRRMLEHPNRDRAARLLMETGLAAVLLPEIVPLEDLVAEDGTGSLWEHTLAVLNELSEPGFSLALAALLHRLADLAEAAGADDAREAALRTTDEICNRWRLSGAEQERTKWLLAHRGALFDAESMPWSELQPLLVHPHGRDLVALDEADLAARGRERKATEFCREKLALPPEELDPPPLLTGRDLIGHGVPTGPAYKLLLDRVRAEQLDGRIGSKEEALEAVDRWMAEGLTSNGDGG